MTRKECREVLANFSRLQLAHNIGALGTYENERGSSFSERCKRWRRQWLTETNLRTQELETDSIVNSKNTRPFVRQKDSWTFYAHKAEQFWTST